MVVLVPFLSSYLIYVHLPVLYYGLEACPVNRDQARSLDYAVHSCFRKTFATTDQSVVEQCMMFFECHHVQDTVGERRRGFLHKFRIYKISCVWHLTTDPLPT